MNELALFAGAGGGILGSVLLGWHTRCAVELDPFGRDVLLARQADGKLERFPVWDDVCTFDGRPWRGHIDVVTGGFPCQDLSPAGKGAGLQGVRSGLWWEMHRVIREVGPRYVLLENVPALANRGLDQILGALASLGFDAEWGVLSAQQVGAPHRRARMWLVASMADTHREGQLREGAPRGEERGRPSHGSSNLVAADRPRLEVREGQQDHAREELEATQRGGPAIGWWAAEPDVGRVAHGMAARVDRKDRMRALGNGQVPAVVAAAWRSLLDRMADLRPTS